MITQLEADTLIAMAKRVVSRHWTFPAAGGFAQMELESLDGREKFVLDVNRKGEIKLTKCTYQERYRRDIVLIRLDIDGPPHSNPDGTFVPCPHIHFYREGFDVKWAFPLPNGGFSDLTNLETTLLDFLKHCKVSDFGNLQMQGGFSI